MDTLTYVKMSRLVRLLLYTSDGDNAFISNPLRLKMLEGVNLTLSPLDFPKMTFLEKRQIPAICDFFRRYEDLLLQFKLFLLYLGG